LAELNSNLRQVLKDDKIVILCSKLTTQMPASRHRIHILWHPQKSRPDSKRCQIRCESSAKMFLRKLQTNLRCQRVWYRKSATAQRFVRVVISTIRAANQARVEPRLLGSRCRNPSPYTSNISISISRVSVMRWLQHDVSCSVNHLCQRHIFEFL